MENVEERRRAERMEDQINDLSDPLKTAGWSRIQIIVLAELKCTTGWIMLPSP